MNAVLLDTTIASLIHPRKKSSTLRVQYEPHLKGHVLAISFQTVAELYAWAEINAWGEKAKEGLDDVIGRFLVLPYERELAKVWGRVQAEGKKQGRVLDSGDSWIAASAVFYGLPLVTHDKDFAELTMHGLTVITYA